MHLPRHFEETRSEVLHALIRERPFATVVAMSGEGLTVEHLPLLFDDKASSLGVLRGHVARENPILRTNRTEGEAVAVFQGPQHYISPSWYPTKLETGKVVPTWNYVVVHAYGSLRFIDDERWVRAHVTELTQRHETPREVPWKVSDAPDEFVEKLIGRIVGVELSITRLTGKWKLGQNRSNADRRGMIEGLLQEREGIAHELAAEIQETIDGGSE